jgi:CRISPR-associated endonuclease Cas1
MGWRVVAISSRAKLELRMSYLVIRSTDETRVFLDEISVLVIENTAVSLTCNLIEALVSKKILVIFCDSKRLPNAMLRFLHGAHNSSLKVASQVNWSEVAKQNIWTAIVKEKIRKQASVLAPVNAEASSQLLKYWEDVELNDSTNREGFAAKVYFNTLFGEGFARRSEDFINSALDYGYAIILSAISREIYSNGYITEIGVFHRNQFNNTNLASDLMEPFRPFVDQCVLALPQTAFELTPDIKHELVAILNKEVGYCGRYTTVLNAIQGYVKSVLSAIEENDSTLITYYEL